jgi:hypothetical protein
MESPFRVISTVYAVAFAAGAHVNDRLEAAPLTRPCGAAAVVLPCETGGCVETAGLVGLAAVAAAAFGGLGGGGGVAAASLSATTRSPDNRSPTKTPEPAAVEKATAAAIRTSSRRAALRLGTCTVRRVRRAGSTSTDSGLAELSSRPETIGSAGAFVEAPAAVSACGGSAIS